MCKLSELWKALVHSKILLNFHAALISAIFSTVATTGFSRIRWPVEWQQRTVPGQT